MNLLEELSRRQWFGMKPGLTAMTAACAALEDPERRLRGVVHVAGTNGKGAVCAMLDACLRAAGHSVARYTSPHLVSINERFFLDGAPVPLAALDAVSQRLSASEGVADCLSRLTYFEFLTLVAFVLYSERKSDFTILETGLGGRLDATNVCRSVVSVITRIGLDHCAWLGDTVEQIAAEKAGIVKAGVPIVLGCNCEAVREVVAARARELGSPFYYAPDLASETEIPADFSLAGTFNRENAVTVLATLKVMAQGGVLPACELDFSRCGFSRTVWPGRFQRIGRTLVDGAHNPPAARALAKALADCGVPPRSLVLVCGFCGDKEVDEVLRILAPFVREARAVKTNNPRSLSAEALTAKMAAVGLPAAPYPSLAEALRLEPSLAEALRLEPSRSEALRPEPSRSDAIECLVCGSLFLAGEALVALGAPGFSSPPRFDAAERLAGTAFDPHSTSSTLPHGCK